MTALSDAHFPILIVEDDTPTAELEAKVLLRSGKTSQICPTAAGAIAALKHEQFGAVLLDYLLADENGWSVLEAAQEAVPAVPVILVTGKGNEEVAAEALRRGVADYIIKNGDYWEQLPNIVERIERIAEAGRLRQCLASVVESSNDAIIGATPQGQIYSWNAAAAAIFGYSPAEAKGKAIADLFAADRRAEFLRMFERMMRGENVRNFETLGVSHTGAAVHLSVALSTVKNELGCVATVSVAARDISERKLAEEHLRRTEHHLRQLQKLDAIKEIAGGVAHEFNNLLTVIIVRSELLKSDFMPDNPMWGELDNIIKTGERAATVSRQLLAFSRQQFLRPKFLYLNAVVTEIQRVIGRVVGESIRIETRLGPDLEQVKADPVKLDEVLLNLAMNARDAMPDGGTLTFETSVVQPSDEFVRTHSGFKPGRYVMLSVSDTGSGMDQATLARVFEPFFTTKGRARRTGLGLAMVYGTIKQSDGYIYVSSEPGKGARFDIYLPCVDQPKKMASPLSSGLPGKAIPKTILIVEDQKDVLELVAFILAESGYSLMTAANPKEALRIAEANTGTIDLLLTDVVMPEMNGPELALRLSALRPQMKVLYMSGYPESHLGTARAETEFISKPFSFESLKRKVHDVLFGKT